MATRPVLCHILRARVAAWKTSAEEPKIPESAATLAEACCTCARQSLRLLCDAWIAGAFPTLDWFHPQYIFSSSMILAVSNILSSGGGSSSGNGNTSAGHEASTRPNDKEQFDAALDILEQLDASGNMLIQEYFRHFEAVQKEMECLPPERRVFGSANAASTSTAAAAATPSNSQMGLPTPSSGFQEQVNAGHNDPGMMAPLSLQELLMQPSLDMQFFDDTFYQDISHGLYWPNFTGGSDMTPNWTP